MVARPQFILQSFLRWQNAVNYVIVLIQYCSKTLCIVAKWCVLEQKLLLTACRAYRKAISTKINDLDICLEVV